MLVFIRVIWNEDATEHRCFLGDIISGNAKRTGDLVVIDFPIVRQLSHIEVALINRFGGNKHVKKPMRDLFNMYIFEGRYLTFSKLSFLLSIT